MIFFTNKPRQLKGLLALFLVGFCFLQSFAQSQTVKGKITDSGNNLPVIGAAVRVVGSTTGTSTDNNGEFSLNVPVNGMLEIKSLSYSPLTIKADATKPMQIKLSPANNDLTDVVVIGYGTAQKKDLTGSIGTLRTAKLEKEAPRSVQDLLRSGIPGLAVGQNSSAKGGGDLQVRGQRSLKAENSPLLVVDGVIFFGELSEINPLDIEQVDVLKDASSAAIYGAKAANGVIIISTKKGKSEKPTIRLTATNSLVTMGVNRPVYDAQGYLDYRQDLFNSTSRFTSPGKYVNPTPENLASAGITYAQWKAYDGLTGSDQEVWLQRIGLFENERANYFAGKTYDWYDASFHTGYSQDYNLSASGQSNNNSTNYYMSLGYLKNEAVVVGDDYRAYRANFKLSQKITKWLTTGINVNFQDRSDGNLAVDWGGQIINNSPFARAFDDNGALIGQPMGASVNQGTNTAYNNQFKELEKGYTVLNTTLYGTVKLPFNITLNTNFSPRYQFFYNRYHESSKNPLWSDNGRVLRETQKNYDWQVDNTLNWEKSFGQKHRLKVTLLQNAEEHWSWKDSMTGVDFSPTDALGFHNIGAATMSKSSFSTDDSHSTGDALMGRIFYSFDDKYMLTATVRRDGYSAFGASNPRATFPSLGFAWNFKDEKFIKWDALSTGKLRLSYGIGGNRSIGIYQALSNLTTGAGKFSYATPSGTVYELGQLYVDRMANTDLKWESTASYNFGLDFGFLNNRINGSIDYYHMPTTDLLIDQGLPPFIGFKVVTANLGEVINDGLELNLNGNIISNPNFQWSANVGAFFNKNKIKHLYYTYTDVTDANGNITSKEDDDVANNWFIGQDINSIWTYKVLGIWQKGEEAEAARYGEIPGDVKVEDVDNDGRYTNADKQFQGSKNPRFRWTLRNDFTLFKNLDVSINVYSYIGQKVTSTEYLNNPGVLIDRSNSYVREYWTPNNPSNEFARLNSTNVQNISPSRVIDRSFIRLDNISMSYLIPTNFTKKLELSQLRVNASVRNVAVYSRSKDWTTWDPETGNILPRTFTLGLTATF
ncbi:SusC/RagA family TonB-linked outer membrane protein [Pedobacter miscanthi]|uniref:SusC/RagA family TonB-linked outer membrane protein n=1 Tax=Pedobacter miscanthi TaxID=2259170 RepID=UPI00292DD9D1|nr:SusC/RagA family TonB-linked outer membrane protein [Pedobacter miscanthi]